MELLFYHITIHNREQCLILKSYYLKISKINCNFYNILDLNETSQMSFYMKKLKFSPSITL